MGKINVYDKIVT